jgi:hypothetical protein
MDLAAGHSGTQGFLEGDAARESSTAERSQNGSQAVTWSTKGQDFHLPPKFSLPVPRCGFYNQAQWDALVRCNTPTLPSFRGMFSLSHPHPGLCRQLQASQHLGHPLCLCYGGKSSRRRPLENLELRYQDKQWSGRTSALPHCPAIGRRDFKNK